MIGCASLNACMYGIDDPISVDENPSFPSLPPGISLHQYNGGCIKMIRSTEILDAMVWEEPRSTASEAADPVFGSFN